MLGIEEAADNRDQYGRLGMRIKTDREQDGSEQGFTLIELLIVTVIIGILATVAIPVFLNQRTKAYDSTAKSDLRNLANFEEIYLNDYGTYADIGTVKLGEPDLFPSKGITLGVVDFTGPNGYCLSATHSGSTNTWYYDSEGGGLQPANTGCPDVTGGTPGTSLTG